MLSLIYFKALADETRLRLLHILYHHELNVNELVAVLDMGQSRISRHLKILTSAGLLIWRRDGLWVFYSTPESDKHHTFLQSIMPFFANETILQDDLRMAVSIVDDRTKQTQQFFNTIAKDWDKILDEVLGDFSLSKFISDSMPQCAIACDLGCGTGGVLESMLPKADHLIGVDGSSRMLEIAKKRFATAPDNVSLRIGDLLHLPLRDAEANFACINLVLHHVSSPVDILKEVYRILAPSSTLIITDFVRHTDERMRTEYGDRWLGFTTEELHAFLTRANFTIITSAIVPVERGLSLHTIQAMRKS